MKTRALTVFLATLALSVGCGDDEPVPLTATQENDLAVDTVDGAHLTSTLAALVAEPLSGTMSGEQAAMTAAMSAGTFLRPSGCVTASASGNVVTYTLANCSGPYGFVRATGTLRATITPNGPGLGYAIVVTGSVTANRGTWTIDATANATSVGGARRAAIRSRTSGTGPRGRQLTQSGDYTASWTGSCLDLTGTWETRAGAFVFNTTATNYRRCQSMCPESGGTVRIATGGGRSVTVTFTATATATVSGSGGRTGTVALFCGM